MAKIKGGYYIKARCIQDSEIAIMPPYIREIWDWLLKEANHSERKVNGSVIERGQLKRSFRDIQEGLKWMIGWRKMTYKKWQCENAMKFLRKRGMVTTMKTTRGMLITVCNYEHYQDPKNYESNTKADTRTTVNKQLTDTINKNDNNVNNDKNVIKEKSVIFLKAWKDFKEMRKKKNKPMTLKAEELIIKELNKLTNNENIQIAILNQSIMNSWQGVFPLKVPERDSEFEYQVHKSKKMGNKERNKYMDTAKKGIKLLVGKKGGN
jgi:hypothetical protein